MIQNYPCIGIRLRQNSVLSSSSRSFDDTSGNNRSFKYPRIDEQERTDDLVGWCLTYPYGAIGMLQVIPVRIFFFFV